MKAIKTLVTNTMKSSDESEAPKGHRFDIFKGVPDGVGKIHKLRSTGYALLAEGSKTYIVHLKTLLDDVFYLCAEQEMTSADYVIFTREASRTPGRKYFWNRVGECRVLSGPNAGLMKMEWDLFGADDIYMDLYPKERDANPITKRNAA